MSEAVSQVVLVTGAANGIGHAIALRLASDGFDVAVNDIPSNKDKLDLLVGEIAKQHEGRRKTTVAVGDVSVEKDVVSMIEKTVKDLGSLNVMIANAGICMGKSFLETTVQDWDRIFSINARGTFLCYQHAAKQMIAQGRGGKIIGACSGSGKQAEPMLSAYGSTKFAIRGITQSAALELGKYGITVNAYAPGAVETDMTRVLGNTLADWDTIAKMEAARAPVGRIGVPNDISDLVSFLASKQSGFITGQSISINGGRFFD